MNVGYFKVVNEDGRACGCGRRGRRLRRGPRPPQAPTGPPPARLPPARTHACGHPAPDSGLRIHAREQTLETIINMMTQAGVSELRQAPNIQASDLPPNVRDPGDEMSTLEDLED